MKHRFLALLLLATLISSCKDPHPVGSNTKEPFGKIEAIIDSVPQIALELLEKYDKSQIEQWPQCDQMEYWLLVAKSCDKANKEPIKEDVMESVADYFSSQDVKEKQIEAYYYLGRTQLLRGFGHKALESFHKALDATKEQETGTDTVLLACIYAQIASIYEEQEHYELALHTTLTGYKLMPTMISQHEIGGAYKRNDNEDSASFFFDKYFEEVDKSNPSAICGEMGEQLGYYTKKHQQDKAKKRLEMLQKVPFENLTVNALYCMGLYHREYGNPDSAIYFWRYIQETSPNIEMKFRAASDLLSLYNERGDKEKALHYALLANQYAERKDEYRRDAQINSAEYTYLYRQLEKERKGKGNQEYARNFNTFRLYLLGILLLCCSIYAIVMTFFYVRTKSLAQTLKEEKNLILQKEHIEFVERKTKAKSVLASLKDEVKKLINAPTSFIATGNKQIIYFLVDYAHPEIQEKLKGSPILKNSGMKDVLYLYYLGINAAETATLLKISKATAHRYISTFKEAGLIEKKDTEEDVSAANSEAIDNKEGNEQAKKL